MPESDRRTILVVDDDEIKRYTVSRLLEKAGFAVVETSTGAGALEAAKAGPDLIILDVGLPDINGFEVCKRIKADPDTSSIIVIHFSATLTDSSDRVVGLEGGADGYLIEPLGGAELIATVRSMLRIREAEHAARRLAHQWQATFDAITSGICLLDENDRVIRCNAAIEGFAGRPAAELVGLDCGELSRGALHGASSLCAEARATGERRFAEYTQDGRWLSVTTDPVSDEDGAVAGAVYIVADVTAVKDRERERAELLGREQAARADAEAANRAKDEFLATISHELRTPLNSMLGWITLLRGGQLGASDVDRALETLERNAKSQAQLISDILDVSRIITGKVRLELRAVDLAAVVAAAVDSARPGADAKGLRLQTAIAQGTASVAGDPERLQQVIWNLLSNAIKFTPKGGLIQVNLRRVASHMEVEVTDTGLGIDPDFLPYVFDRFRQADSSTTRTHTGLGLGLSIVRHLVELHGGAVHVESEGAGLGSTFRVTLPLAPSGAVEPPKDTTRAVEYDAGLTGFALLDGVRVVVVDDDEDTRVMLAAILERCGAEVRAASSAAGALEEVATWVPDVLLSDIGMPDVDGHALIRSIRALPAEQGGRVPAIALTAYARTEDKLKALAAGFQMYVSKPADPAEVTAVVASLAGRMGRR